MKKEGEKLIQYFINQKLDVLNKIGGKEISATGGHDYGGFVAPGESTPTAHAEDGWNGIWPWCSVTTDTIYG